MRNKHNTLAIAWLCIAGLLLLRILFSILYLSSFTDSDQILFALMGKDYSAGIFHVPMVYGQSYNFPLESYLSVPLFWCGTPWHVSLPLVTSILGVFPLLLLATSYIKTNKPEIAVFIAVFTCMMCPEWHYITSIPRGFTGGIAAVFIGVFLLVKYHQYLQKIFGAFLIAIGILLAPNSAAIVLVAVFLPTSYPVLSLRNSISLLVGIIPACVLYFIIHNFYTTHPFHIIHPSPGLNWSLGNIGDGIAHWWQHFYHLGWLHPITGILWPLLFVLFGYLYWKCGEVIQSIASFSGILWVLVLMGFNKTQDGSIAQDLPLSRFWLPLPIAGIAMIAAYVYKNKLALKMKTLWSLAVISSLLFVSFTVRYFQNTEARNASAKMVEIYRTTQKKQESDWLANLRKRNQSKLVLLADIGEFTYLNPISDRQGDYYYPVYERKTWIKRKYELMLPESFLFVCKNKQFTPEASTSFASRFLDSASGILVYKIEKNKANTWDFKQEIGF